LNPALSELKDIHLPEAVSWWPLAPGYWISLAIIILIALISLALYWQWKKHWRYIKAANNEFDDLVFNNHDDKDFLHGTSVFIRRYIITRSDEAVINSLQGTQWQNYLENYLSNDHAQLLAFDQYKPDVNYDKQALIDDVKNLIKGYKK
jgi:hypothetical protein